MNGSLVQVPVLLSRRFYNYTRQNGVGKAYRAALDTRSTLFWLL
jgi:hypothetical protein